jgi:hypothetical protein
MSRKLFAFLLSELKIVRIICKRNECNGIIELPTSELRRASSAKCPKCGDDFISNGFDPNVLGDLDKAIEAATCEKSARKFQIEFVIEDKDK